MIQHLWVYTPWLKATDRFLVPMAKDKHETLAKGDRKTTSRRVAAVQIMEVKSHLPNFFVLGAQRAGTTSLFHFLIQHPEIYIPRAKETGYFLAREVYEKGPAFYVNEFYGGARGFKAIGDASAQYLIDESVAQRIKKDIPSGNQRFIVILREPVSRAYSSYWYSVRKGFETLSFEAAIATEDERVSRLEREGQRWWWAYYRGGCYASNLAAFFEYFDRSQFLILFQEDLRQGEHVCRSMFDFLGVDPTVRVDTTRKHNEASLPRYRFIQDLSLRDSPIMTSVRRIVPRAWRTPAGKLLQSLNAKPFAYPEMNPETARVLRSKYRDEVDRLMDMTGRDLSHWMAGPASPSEKPIRTPAVAGASM